MPRVGAVTVTGIVRTTGAKDGKGLAARVETRFSIPGCTVVPLTENETVGQVDMTQDYWRLYAPAGGPVERLTATSAVELPDGRSFEVTGPPQQWRDHRGHPHHSTVFLRRPEG